MVLRVEALGKGTGYGYTPKIRELETDWESAAEAYNKSGVERETVTLALQRLEQAWMVEIARAKRVRRAAVGGTP